MNCWKLLYNYFSGKGQSASKPRIWEGSTTIESIAY